MKYCLLIHISRNFISFCYNKEGDKGFIPYGEEPRKPLAVYCQGNEISIGTFALSEAQKGNKFAHANLFDAMSSTELIEYKGQKHDINKLMFFAMEKYVAEFFDRILMRSEGSLEDNRARFPVILLFNPDLRYYERDYVFKSLIAGGYGNLLTVNASQLYEKVVCSKMAAGTVPIFVGGDGCNLYCESDKANLSELVTLEKVAIDPRIDRALRIMRSDLLYQGYDEFRSDKDFDMGVLRKRTADFLNSTKREEMFSVTLSDGMTYDVFLKRTDFGMSSNSVSDEAMVAFSKLKSLLDASGTQVSQCYIVLTDREVVNEYVENLFRHYFSNVIGINDEQRLRALQALIDKVVSMDYNFTGTSPITKEADETFASGKFKEAREKYKALNSAKVEGKIANCTSCIKDERRIREFLSLPIETQRREKDDILSIFSKWAKLGVDDDFINSYKGKLDMQMVQVDSRKETIEDVPITNVAEKTDDSTSVSISSEADKAFAAGRFKEARELYKGMNTAAVEGKIANCASCIRDERRIREFISMPIENQRREKDDVLKIFSKWASIGVGGDYINSQREKLDKHVMQQPLNPKEKLNVISEEQAMEGEKLMKELKFKEAKAWFADNGHTAKARDCSTLIKAVRFLKAYKAEMASIKNNHNLQLAKSHLEDMRGWRAIYANYGLDTKDIDDLINIYKTIK